MKGNTVILGGKCMRQTKNMLKTTRCVSYACLVVSVGAKREDYDIADMIGMRGVRIRHASKAWRWP